VFAHTSWDLCVVYQTKGESNESLIRPLLVDSIILEPYDDDVGGHSRYVAIRELSFCYGVLEKKNIGILGLAEGQQQDL
jgi:hypothetical protein